MMGFWARCAAVTLLVGGLHACGGSGSGGADSAVPNRAPRALSLATGDARPLPSGGLGATIGGVVRLDGNASTDPDADVLSFSWTLLAKPAGSAASVTATSVAAIELRPDVQGEYALSLKVTDSKGASSTQQVTVVADNRAPVASVVGTPQFTPVPTVAPDLPVSIGASVLIDASGSTDPDGDAVSVAFALTDRPAGSTALLTVQGKTARFTADVAGPYRVRAVGTDGQGASYQSDLVFSATNQAPNPVLLARADPVVSDAGEQTLAASVGYDIVLDGSASSDPEQQPLTYLWTLASRPAGSTAGLSSTTGSGSGFSPDVLGEYLVTLAVSDPAGASSVRRLRVQVNNRRPLAQIGSNATPQAAAAAPGLRVPLGTELTLRGSLSSDADGDPITYRWSLDTRPPGSTAALSSTTAADPQFTPDRDGSYVLRLRVTDPSGAFSERSVTVEAGAHAPVAVVDRGSLTVLLGSAARASAAMSFDDDGDVLNYSWSLDSRPAGSQATLSAAGGPELQFTPDVVGTYVAAVTVRDATRAAVAQVTIRVLPIAIHVSSLPFAPNEARYSRELDSVVAIASDPNAVHIIDPFTGQVRSVMLPAAARNLRLSPNGRLALALHDSSFSLVDLVSATLVHTTPFTWPRNDAWVSDGGIAFLIGPAGSSPLGTDAILVFDARTGALLPQGGNFGYIYLFTSADTGVMADRLNKVFTISNNGMAYFGFNPATAQITQFGPPSPYYNSYPALGPLFLSDSQDLLFTALGTYFRTDTLQHAGQLENAGTIASLSHSASQDELLVLSKTYYGGVDVYPSSYRRYAGQLMLWDVALAMPSINGAQAYGIRIFHSVSGQHVILAQTGSDKANGPGAAYFLIVR